MEELPVPSFDLDPLIECDDEYWETGDQKKAFIQPRGKPSTMSYWNSYLRLTEIHGFALLTVVRGPLLLQMFSRLILVF